MLRFKPIATLAGRRSSRRSASARRTRCRPRRRPTARTCSTAPRAAAARPSPRSTRWACATRAASRSTPRPTCRTRRGSAPTPARRARTQGPSTYENAAQITHAGNYGWPYCMGNKQPYRDRLADGALRTDSPAGYVPGGPATGGTDGWYDCDNLRNDSPNNTGLVEFPHADRRPARTPARCAATTSGTRAATRQRTTAARTSRARAAPPRRPNYGATPTQLCPYAQQRRHDDHGRPGLPLQRRARDNSKRWPRVLGRPLVPAQQRRPVDQARPAARPGHRQARRPADLRRQPARHADLERGSYMDSKFGTDGALYVQTYDGFFRAGPTSASTATTTSAARRRRTRRRGRSRSATSRPLLERRLGRRLLRSGSSATGRPRPRPTRRTRTPRPSATRRS